ncbi:hypothetical protein BN1708_020454, partial [Verticillium longisporum]
RQRVDRDGPRRGRDAGVPGEDAPRGGQHEDGVVRPRHSPRHRPDVPRQGDEPAALPKVPRHRRLLQPRPRQGHPRQGDVGHHLVGH